MITVFKVRDDENMFWEAGEEITDVGSQSRWLWQAKRKLKPGVSKMVK